MRQIMVLVIVALAGCHAAPVPCEGHLTAINVTHQAAAVSSAPASKVSP